MRGTLLILLLPVALQAAAETMYVSDQLVITVRAAPSAGAEILTHLRTGDAVEVLERPAGSEFVKVRLEDGVQGWALNQYLMPNAAAVDRLARAETELAQSRRTAGSLRTELDKVKAELATTSGRMVEAEASASTLTEQLDEIRAVSENAFTLRDANENLERRVQELESEVSTLSRENSVLTSRSHRDWFLAGGGVLLVGILVGLVLPRLKRRQRWDW